ncbi:type II toxin-antitoxin system VapC family toxin [Gloeobacter morelensis]|uniref:Ribonuclease VapC n=1 Tax=Gloeobacter morelensis MG652769 TaxID=2781736 RepID=A0ABY3PRJ4_9CYAN|nr:type II toxin-antitoxin system VapC family toxin [Gloeobacter morelensis]UFP96350.1 type II toxin-antitoxin system VapC family toxin [Gloeobacter morelensis MG652769]
MIAIDTSAIVAILLGEPEAERFARAIEQDEEPLLSAASLVELFLVMKHKQGSASAPLIEQFLATGGISVCSVTPEQARRAQEAAYRFGILNFGDVFSYALAKERGIGLLFKGTDFAVTDLIAAPF